MPIGSMYDIYTYIWLIFMVNLINILVGGFKPFEKYISQIGSSPQLRVKNKTYLKAPPIDIPFHHGSIMRCLIIRGTSFKHPRSSNFCKPGGIDSSLDSPWIHHVKNVWVQAVTPNGPCTLPGTIVWLVVSTPLKHY